MQREITQPTPLLTAQGQLTAPGYARTMHYRYNREAARSFPLKLKEWNFYQIQMEYYVLQLTLGHVSYMCSATAALMDIRTGQKWELGAMTPFFQPKLDLNPEEESTVSFRNDSVDLCFQVTKTRRVLKLQGSNKQFSRVKIHIELENDVHNEKMVIATPFEKPDQFYLNYKENFYRGTGSVQFDDLVLSFDGCTALIDWGRGIWPYRHQWFWGSLTSRIDGTPFGFNIGWGFGDLRHATENMFFYNKKAYKLGTLEVQRKESDYMQPWHLRDPEGKLEMTFTPLWDNYTENKFVVVDTHCNQVFGRFSGSIQTGDGMKSFADLLGFIEHAVNRW